MSANRPSENVISPAQSIGDGSCAVRFSSLLMVSAIAAAPIGMFTKKIHSQPRPSVSAPPIVAPQAPMAVPRSRPWNSCAMRASEVANIAAPPTPWRPRARLRRVALGEIPHRNEATVKIKKPNVKTRRRPIRSASEPAVSRNAASVSEYASTTHWRLERLAPRLDWMSGSATLTTVMSSSSMNVATHTASKVHHLRAIRNLLDRVAPVATFTTTTKGRSPNRQCEVSYRDLGEALGESLVREPAELLADAAVEGLSGQLRERAQAGVEGDLHLTAARELRDGLSVEHDVHRLAPGLVDHAQDVVGRNHQRPRGERVRSDEADHVALDSPREDRALVGEVVAGGSDRRRGHQPVATHVTDLLPAEPVRELGDASVRPPDERDVVQRDRTRIVDLHSQAGNCQRLEVARESAAQPGLELVTLDRGEEADCPEVDAEHGYPGAGVGTEGLQDGPVAAQHQAQVRLLGEIGGLLDARGGFAELGVLLLCGDHRAAALGGGIDRGADGGTGLLRPRMREQHCRSHGRPGSHGIGAHGSTFATAAWRSSLPSPSGAHQMKVSRFPFGPGRPEDANPFTARPAPCPALATLSRASRRSSTERTTPPRTRPRPSSN